MENCVLSASSMAMLRAAESSQLLWNRELWMGTESVCPSRRIGLGIFSSVAAIFCNTGNPAAETWSSPETK